MQQAYDYAHAPTYKDAFHYGDTEYKYDKNGRMTQNLDNNISLIQYNSLNLPRKIEFTDNSTIENTYGAMGNKIYYFNVTDHLGSVRAVTDEYGDFDAVQGNEYYTGPYTPTTENTLGNEGLKALVSYLARHDVPNSIHAVQRMSSRISLKMKPLKM